jgi:hypothetical protein
VFFFRFDYFAVITGTLSELGGKQDGAHQEIPFISGAKTGTFLGLGQD